MDRLSGPEVDQSNLDWIHNYPFTMDTGTDTTGLTGGPSPSWRPAMSLNTYDFGGFDETLVGRKFSMPHPSVVQSSLAQHVSPSPSLFPSVSSEQSSPHTSPTSVDRTPRGGDSRDPAYNYVGTGSNQARDVRRGGSMPALKRSRDDFEQPPPRNVKLDEENRYLVYLRDHQRLPWKEISRKFEQTFQRPYQAPALQMRYGRLKNRLHPWTDADTNALQMAQEYYANKRFEIIAEKMLEFGATDVWSPRLCARKLRQLEKEGHTTTGPASPTGSHSSREEEQALQQKPYGVRVGDVTLRSTSPPLPGGPTWNGQ